MLTYLVIILIHYLIPEIYDIYFCIISSDICFKITRNWKDHQFSNYCNKFLIIVIS